MKTGLVLEGGALRTMFAAGVCDAFLQAGIEFDYVCGVSAGIAYGVSYLSHQYGRNLEIAERFVNDPRYMGKRCLIDPKNRAYFGLDFVYREIPETLIPFDYDAFARWPGQVEAVLTDLDTGKAAYVPVPRDGEGMTRVLEASCAMPLLFPVFHIGGRRYLDGGCADSIPFRRALEQGCDRVVVVLSRERSYLRKPELLPLIRARYHRHPEFVRTMERRANAYNAQRAEAFQLEREGRLLLFTPQSTQGYSRTERDLDKIRALYQSGLDRGLAQAEAVRCFLSGS